jgi:FkbM family methyltransferase
MDKNYLAYLEGISAFDSLSELKTRLGNSAQILRAPKSIDRIYELEVIEYFATRIPWHGLFLDVGAHVGFYTIALSPCFKKVIAFEPSRKQIEYLRHNLIINNLVNVTLEERALSEFAGETNLYVMGNSGGSNTISSCVAKIGNPMEIYSVQVTTIDELLLNDISFIKIDAEGSEFSILKGGRKAIAKYRPYILLEIWEESDNKDNIISFLEEMDYRVEFPFINFKEIALATP